MSSHPMGYVTGSEKKKILVNILSVFGARNLNSYIMRTQQQMLELILSTAKSDERICAVIMNGSRVNPNARKDIFQDFDIVYAVTDVDSFTDDHSWISCFGDLMVHQMPDAMENPTPANAGCFAYLMQFTDGNRIDLTLMPADRMKEIERDSLSVLLLDKDQVIEPFPAPTDTDYLPSPPTSKAFFDCCNEFWWVCPYVAKGLWREEIVYAKHMLDNVVRPQLEKMLTWDAGTKTQFSCNLGIHGKYFKEYLEPELWDMLEKTYSDASYENTWNALEMMCELFRVTASEVARLFLFDYPRSDDDKVSAHLKHVRSLGKDAQEIY